MWDTLGSDSERGFCYLPSHSSRPAMELSRRGGWYWLVAAAAAVVVCHMERKKSALFSVPLSSSLDYTRRTSLPD